MVDKTQQETEDPEVMIESAIGRTELFIQKNGKTLLIILAAAVIVVGGFFSYKYLYAAPRQEKASAAIFAAQNLFAADSFAVALNGDGNNDGFLQVIEKYGSTESGNLAKHYAAQCYLRMGEYDNAIKYFEKYSDVSGIPSQIINAMNAGLTGDAYVQLGNMDKALKMYDKAISVSENMLSAPYYSRKAAQVCEKLGQNEKALELYKSIKAKYPQSMEAMEVDKYIAQLEQKL